MELVGSALDGVVLDALPFVHGGVADGLDLQLVDGVYRDGGPDETWVALAGCRDEGGSINVDIRHGAAGAATVHDASVGGGVAVGFVELHAGEEYGKVGGSAGSILPVGSHLDRKLRVDVLL